MAQYRTQSKIIADILATARDMNTDGQGVGITTLLRTRERLLQQDDQAHRRPGGRGLLLEETHGEELEVQDKRQGHDASSRPTSSSRTSPSPSGLRL